MEECVEATGRPVGGRVGMHAVCVCTLHLCSARVWCASVVCIAHMLTCVHVHTCYAVCTHTWAHSMCVHVPRLCLMSTLWALYAHVCMSISMLA